MPVIYSNHSLEEIADTIVSILKDKGFVIQRYDAYSTDSVYLKLDYGVCNSIRISDHVGKGHLKYRYNVILDGEVNIVEDTYIRYYYNKDTIDYMINQIMFDKQAKVLKYGKTGYKNFMYKNMMQHKSDNKGFWHQARLIK